MPDVDQPFTQVLTWRVEQLRIRIIQAAVVGLMSIAAIGRDLGCGGLGHGAG